MLRSLKINKLEEYPQHCIKNIVQKFNFDKGLNIIVGSNGSGKSTILKFIKASYGINDVHKSSKYNVDSSSDCKNGVMEKDIELVRHCTFDKDIQVAIDCDRFYHNTGMRSPFITNFSTIDTVSFYNSNCMSSGEHKMSSQSYLQQFIESMKWLPSKYSDFYESLQDRTPLLLFDEPTLGMSPEVERMFFKYMLEWSTNFQIIIASNSIFMLDLPCNFIEIEKGYIDKQKKFIKHLYDCYTNEEK